jgi:hypothetical protein
MIKVGIRKPHLLPTLIKIDIETLMGYGDMDITDLMATIKKRSKEKIEFSIEDLKKYLDETMESKKNKILIPILPAEINFSNGKDKIVNLDNSPTVDYRNRAQVLDYWGKKILDRVRLLEDPTLEGSNARMMRAADIEAAFIKYMELSSNIIEKQERLKLNVMESTKFDAIIKEKIDMLFIVLKSSIKGHTTPEQYANIVKDMAEKIVLYKF